MRVYVRFYKSFNYDYERKFTISATPERWEHLDGSWYPYVRLDLDSSITTVVGANEAGKSHLLDSIEKLITGTGISRSDFCRYSRFFSVEEGQRRSPDFGGEFEVTNQDDVAQVKSVLGLDIDVGGRFPLFRENGQYPVVYLEGQEEPLSVDPALSDILPVVFRLDANLPLPASIPLYELSSKAKRPAGSRRARWTLFDQILGKEWASSDQFAKAAPKLFGTLSEVSAASDHVSQQYQLGRDLLLHVARIDPTTFEDLSSAIADEREGYVNGIIQKINSALAAQLNFPRWWEQDREFRLMVSPREYDLVFTIRDRTGTDYSFSERSNGLRYFLSYHVQLLAHESPPSGQNEILLMDEPDAYLSSQGQQDLLRILEEFATPEDGSRHRQVVYVTHSPFLINRNAGSRIRVLDKGTTDEGTRVVRDAARNHYEPLRSSLGTFVAETSFIGGANLFVEGLADQVLLAGVSSHLHAKGMASIDTLDLNRVTIVPAGSASSIPYLVYLARGRDVVRPPSVVLLDSDSSGDDAVKALARGGPRRKELLPSRYVIQVGEWAKQQELDVVDGVVVRELEDLVSLSLAVVAARNYATKVAGVAKEDAQGLSEADISAELNANSSSLFDALLGAYSKRFGDGAHIEKVGFAKEVVSALATSRDVASRSSDFRPVERNMGALLKELALRLRRAVREEDERRVNRRLDRAINGFLADFTEPTTRERGLLLVEEIQATIDDSEEGDRIRVQTEKLRRGFGLDENLTDPIGQFDFFRDRVRGLLYEERLAKRETHDAVTLPSSEKPSNRPRSTPSKRSSRTSGHSEPEAN